MLNSLLYFPSRELVTTPGSAGLEYTDLSLETEDGERLHGWWIAAGAESLGHVLLCHGNAGNIGDRVVHAALLSAAGFDVLLFDYRGYGQSSGRPTERGTYRDARSALAWMLEQRLDGRRVIYLGESLGGAIALELALEEPPAGLVLLSTFTGIREMGELLYSFIPTGLVPDAYPSLRRVPQLRAPLLVLHGEQDEVVPLAQARALFQAAPEPKRMRTFPGVAHNDVIALAGRDLVQEIGAWVRSLRSGAA
jgi:fermentation-respiration switch protein FrsA (DUF1100 family)